MKQITREWLAFLREQYPVGSRIRLNSMEDPYAPVEPGTMGTLQRIDDAGQFLMKWDNGRTLSLIPGEDSFSLILPEPTMMKLYMPLHADLYTKDDWSDTSEEPEMLTGRALMEYEDSILIALIKNRMSEEAERGIMRWYGREDSVDRKVKSVVFTAEEREGQLWGVAECKVVGELTPEELDTLKDYISGQASDGWGEGFEQREIQVDDGELYVHLWNFGDWSIQTEEECFSPKLAEGLPDMCFSNVREEAVKAMDRTRLQDFRKLLNNLFESGKCYRIEEAMEHINFAKAEISLWMIIDEVPDGRIKKCTQLSMITIEARHLLLQKK